MDRPLSRWPDPAPILAAMIVGAVLVVDPGGWQPFGPAKWVVITTLSFLALAAAFRAMAAARTVTGAAGRGSDLHLPSLVGWGAFLVWAGITASQADDPLAAWLGTPDRRFGVVALVTLAAAYLGGQGVATPSGRRLLARGAVVALLGCAAYGVAEWAGWTLVDLTTTTTRVGSTLGSPAYLGAALCLLLPMAAALGLDGEEDRRWRVAAAMAAVGAALLLAGSGTRAALVGLVVGGGVTALRVGRPPRRHLAAVVAVLVATAAMVAVSPLGRRLVDPEGVRGRTAEWKVAVDVLADAALMGTGPEGYRIAFPAHVDVDYVRQYGRDTVTDRAHSGPLDLGVTTGVVGGLAWLVAAGWLGSRSWRAMDAEDKVLTGLAAGLIALWAQELFLFPTLEVSGIGWAVAGSVVAADHGGGLHRFRSPTVAIAGVALAVALAVAALIVGVLGVVADRGAAAANRSLDPELAAQAAELRPDDFRLRLLAADLSARTGDMASALEHVEAAARSHPGDPALRRARARILLVLVAEDAVGARRAAATVAGMVEADPHHPELRLIHGELAAYAGLAGEAERAWLAAAELAPEDPAPYLRLASLYLTLDRPDEARRSLDIAAALDPAHPDLEDLRDRIGT